MFRRWKDGKHPSYHYFKEELEKRNMYPLGEADILKNKFTVEEVSQHNTPDDCWCIYKNKVYDCTIYSKGFHPGGQSCFTKYAGKDITQVSKVHSFIHIDQYMRDVCIGVIDNGNQENQQNQENQNQFEQQQEDVVTTIHGQIL